MNDIMVKKTITITVEGGLIQDVSGIPEGVEVKVLDFDAEEFGDEDDGRTEVIDGRRAWVLTWQGGQNA